MNIFILDRDIKKAARYHCDKHVVKMITETAQLLSSAYYFTNEESLAPYRLTHKNHPCAVWARENLNNWLWLQEFGIELYIEYQYRYENRIHKSGEVILNMQQPNLSLEDLTKQPLCMGEEYKLNNVVDSYRKYYLETKSHLFNWKNRDRPEWTI